MMTTTTLRLPGVYFLPPPQRAPLGLPPLDVAAFVGFAERGPLHTPVAVDSFDVYRAIFGGDLPLAREQGEGIVYAHLPTAVSTFFANEGQRCYVVRVAGSQATASRLRLPGLLALNGAGQARPAAIEAASAGRWSARLRLATRLRATPLPTNAFTSSGNNQLVWQTGSAPQAVSVGDLLRLTLPDGEQWLFPVTAVTPAAAGSLTLTAAQTWQQTTTVASPPPTITEVRRLTMEGDSLLTDLTVDLLPDGNQLTVELSGDDSHNLETGDVLWLRLDDAREAFFPLTTLLRHSGSLASPLAPQASATTAALLQSAAAPLSAFSSSAWRRIERLRFDLVLQDGPTRQITLAELAFNQGHDRFWGEVALLESSPLHRQSATDSSGRPAAAAANLYRQIISGRRTREDGRMDPAALSGLLAPLSAGAAGQTYLPLDMLTVLTADDFRGPDQADIGDDDLDTFTAVPFLDPDLVPDPDLPVNNSRTLLAEAFDKYYDRNERLLGLHSLLFIDEVALISLPDAAQPGWQIVPPLSDPPAQPPPAALPDWSQFMGCPDEEPLEEQTADSPLPSVSVDALPQRLPINDDEAIPFSQRYPSLLNLQRAIVTFCQARRDVVGILCLPVHFEKRQCIEWQQTLRQQLGLPRYRTVHTDNHILTDLSYVAVYHPWLLVADANARNHLRAIPGDGAVSGSIAARENRRHVWVAPANVPLQGVLGLAPEFSREDWAELFARQFNLVRPEARDFRLMSAHTLSDDAALLQLSVRRLMILVRKFAMQRGMDYVFESNDERLRLGVQFSLEEMLNFLYERGAFAGVSPQQAFRVVTDEQVNTRQRADEGQFIARIQVAPSQPLEFITVLLLRLSEGLQVAEV